VTLVRGKKEKEGGEESGGAGGKKGEKRGKSLTEHQETVRTPFRPKRGGEKNRDEELSRKKKEGRRGKKEGDTTSYPP